MSSPLRSAPAVRALYDDDAAEPSSITDVFANMLEINEDLLAAAAELHTDRDSEGSIAYQRLVHRNLLEMANFIDARFGVYTKSEDGDDTSSLDGASDTSERLMDDEEEITVGNDGLAPLEINETVTTTTSDRLEEQEQVEDADAVAGTGANSEPSALLATLEAKEAAKVKKRSQKQWIKAREQIIEQESVNAGLKAAPAASVASPSESATPRDAAPPSQVTNPPVTPLQSPPLTSLPLDATAPLFAPPVAGLAPLIPLTGPRIALPTTHSLVSVLYPMAASVYQPIQLATTCPHCTLQGGTAQECRLTLKHVAPPLLFDPIAVPGLGLIQWPPPPPPPPMDMAPTVPTRQMIAKSLKRMCEECRKCHFSVHRCRTVLQHTAPEWQPAASAPAAPRRRKTGASRRGGGAKQASS